MHPNRYEGRLDKLWLEGDWSQRDATERGNDYDWLTVRDRFEE